MVSLQLRFRRSSCGSCSVRALRRLRSLRYNFPPNTFLLQSPLRGSKPQVEVASARRKLPDHDSTLPRLLMAVYTPLLRCATAREACKLAAGYGLSKRGAASVPRFAFVGLASDASILSEPLPTESQDARE